MATYFSNLIAASTANTTLVEGFKAPAGIANSRLRKKVGRATTADSTGFQTTDVVRMVTLKSTDYLHTLELTADGTATAGAVNVGVYLTGTAHDGAVEDADMFATAVTISTELDLTNVMTEGTLVDGVDRGKQMWEIVNLGSGETYTADSRVEFDITIVPSTNFDDDTELTLTAVYTAGD